MPETETCDEEPQILRSWIWPLYFLLLIHNYIDLQKCDQIYEAKQLPSERLIGADIFRAMAPGAVRRRGLDDIEHTRGCRATSCASSANWRYRLLPIPNDAPTL